MGAAAAFNVNGSTPDELSYLLTGDGAATTTTAITCTGAVSPDLVTDIAALAAAGVPVGGPLRQVIRCQLDGLGGTVAIGAALTQAGARALFNSDGTIANSNQKTPKLELRFQPRTGVAAWSVDVNVAAGAPIIEVTTSAAAGTALLRVKVHNPLR